MFGDISETCSAVFGTQRIPAVTSLLEALGPTSYILTVTTPGLDTVGRVPIGLTCRDASAIDGFVVYQPPPRVTAVAVQGNCVALAECDLVVTVSDPPETVKVIDDLDVSITGAKFVARVGTTDASIRVNLILIAADRLILRLQTPPALTESTLNGGQPMSCILDIL